VDIEIPASMLMSELVNNSKKLATKPTFKTESATENMAADFLSPHEFNKLIYTP
jgi:hypothetical protein